MNEYRAWIKFGKGDIQSVKVTAPSKDKAKLIINRLIPSAKVGLIEKI